MTKPSRLSVENRTGYDLVVQPYRQQKDFDWKQAGITAFYGVAAIVAWVPGPGKAIGLAADKVADLLNARLARTGYADRIPQGAAGRAAVKKLAGTGAKVFTPVKFLDSLNDNFKYGDATKNLAPKGDAFKIEPGQSRYIVDADTRPGIQNGIKDIITGISLKSGDAALDLGRFAIDNPSIGRSKAFYAPQDADGFDNKADTSSKDFTLNIPYTNLSFTFKHFDEQYDIGTGKMTMTWGLYVDQNGENAIDVF